MAEAVDSIYIAQYRQLITEMIELSSLLNPELVLEYLARAAVRLAGAEMAWVFVTVPSRKLVCQNSCYSLDGTHISGQTVAGENSLEGWVFSNQLPVTINNVIEYDISKGEIIRITDVKIKSVILLPITYKGKRFGILEVANKITGDFSSLDLEVLEAACLQSAICCEKSGHFVQAELIPELVHELRTPLAALNTALHLLQRSDLSEAKREHISKLIQTEFTRLSDLTTSFLDYARLESGKDKFIYTQFDFSQLVHECLEIIQIQLDGKDIKLSLNLPKDPLFLFADRDKIKQVILNLLSNAIKYNPPGGSVMVNAYSTATHLIFDVEDNGPGIPAEYLPRLFERFYRIPTTERQIKGTGLGLTISKHIVEVHAGEIEVTSQLGQGSKFTVRLPLGPD